MIANGKLTQRHDAAAAAKFEPDVKHGLYGEPALPRQLLELDADMHRWQSRNACK